MTAVDAYRALRDDVAAVDRSDRGFVVVSGPDARSYLQNIVSQDLEPVEDGQGASSLLCHPQGKLDHLFRVLRVGDDYWLDVDPGRGAALFASLSRFKIRVKCDVEDRSRDSGSGDWGMASFIGPRAIDSWGRLVEHVEPPEVVHAHVPLAGGARLVRTEWAGIPGLDVVGPREAVERVLQEALAAGVVASGVEAFEPFRIASGVPVVGVDVDDGTIPQEAFLERDSVSFTKGCFLGQELVCRIDTRGHVNRYLRGVRVAGGDVPPRGAPLAKNGKDLGGVTSAAAVPGENRVVALAMVRREVAPPDDVTVRVDGRERSATVEELPLHLEDET